MKRNEEGIQSSKKMVENECWRKRVEEEEMERGAKVQGEKKRLVMEEIATKKEI